ncbi:MAG: nodulation protein NfeD [Cytophagaceae bacterium]|nr:nodulation protein NfeD [Cytophagaceae bacterium]
MKGLYQNSKHILYGLSFIIACVLSTFQSYGATSSGSPVIWVLSIDAEIDPRMSLYVAKGLKEAETQGATQVIIQMNTFGGALEDAEKIRNLLINTKVPVWVFINKNAASAGALISIACDKIYMAQGSNIGAATVVNGDGEPAPDKYQAYMRSLMRSTAEVSHRDPSIAEGMVGRPLAQDSSTIGHVISYTTAEAIANHFCEGQVSTIAEILTLNHLSNFTIHYYAPSTTDEVVAFFMNPLLRSLLILLIIGGIYFELQAPGIGFPLIAAATGLILYFVPSYLSGLSQNWEIVLFFIGVALLAVELFIIPGFGVIGVSGIVCMLASLVLVSVNNQVFDFTFVAEADLELLLLMTGASTCIVFLLFFTLGRKVLQSRYFKKITLQEQQFSAAGYTVNTVQNLVGQSGTAFTDLRPSGKVMVDGKLYDAYTAGEFIAERSEIVVKEQSMGSLKVRMV